MLGIQKLLPTGQWLISDGFPDLIPGAFQKEFHQLNQLEGLQPIPKGGDFIALQTCSKVKPLPLTYPKHLPKTSPRVNKCSGARFRSGSISHLSAMATNRAASRVLLKSQATPTFGRSPSVPSLPRNFKLRNGVLIAVCLTFFLRGLLPFCDVDFFPTKTKVQKRHINGRTDGSSGKNVHPISRFAIFFLSRWAAQPGIATTSLGLFAAPRRPTSAGPRVAAWPGRGTSHGPPVEVTSSRPSKGIEG